MQFVRSIRPIRYGKPHVLTGETIQRNLRDRLKSTERDEAKDLKCQGMATACGKVVWAPYEVLTRGDVYCPDGPSICMTCKKHEDMHAVAPWKESTTASIIASVLKSTSYGVRPK